MTAISFENALGVHEMAIHLRTKRSEVLANNLANADTPGFKARDFDFGKVLKQTMKINDGSQLRRTHVNHISTSSIQNTLDALGPNSPFGIFRNGYQLSRYVLYKG